jgi:hypothetical protein
VKERRKIQIKVFKCVLTLTKLFLHDIYADFSANVKIRVKRGLTRFFVHLTTKQHSFLSPLEGLVSFYGNVAKSQLIFHKILVSSTPLSKMFGLISLLFLSEQNYRFSFTPTKKSRQESGKTRKEFLRSMR